MDNLLQSQQAFQLIDENLLIRMNQCLCLRKAEEFRSVHLPGGRLRLRLGGSRTGKAMDALAALGVIDESQRCQRTGCNTSLFQRLTSSGILECFAFVGQTLGDAPWCFAIVI